MFLRKSPPPPCFCKQLKTFRFTTTRNFSFQVHTWQRKTGLLITWWFSFVNENIFRRGLSLSKYVPVIAWGIVDPLWVRLYHLKSAPSSQKLSRCASRSSTYRKLQNSLCQNRDHDDRSWASSVLLCSVDQRASKIRKELRVRCAYETRGIATTRHRSLFGRGGRPTFVRGKALHTHQKGKKCQQNRYARILKKNRAHRASSKTTRLFLTK